MTTYYNYSVSVEFFDGTIRTFDVLASSIESAIADLEEAYGQKIVHVYHYLPS